MTDSDKNTDKVVLGSYKAGVIARTETEFGSGSAVY